VKQNKKIVHFRKKRIEKSKFVLNKPHVRKNLKEISFSEDRKRYHNLTYFITDDRLVKL
jgi:hypothetical protein